MDDRELRERVEKRLKARQEFTIHLTVYIIANLFLWFLWFLMTGIGVGGEALADAGFPWPLIVMGGWGIGLVIHGLDVYSKTSAAALRYEARVQQEMELERQRIAEI
ncbi:MAG: 2TM domain-containing protein, partial [Anaerolineae bacterium]|nr:2TM domain-containing protein [Anaerolineae bacterium]